MGLHAHTLDCPMLHLMSNPLFNPLNLVMVAP